MAVYREKKNLDKEMANTQSFFPAILIRNVDGFSIGCGYFLLT